MVSRLIPAGFADRQERAALALLSGANHADAAQAAGVSRRTLTPWQEAPEFRARLRALGDEAYSQARDMLRASLPRAVATMAGLLGSSDEGIKLRAAAGLLRWLAPEPSREGVEAPSERGTLILLPAERFEDEATRYIESHGLASTEADSQHPR